MFFRNKKEESSVVSKGITVSKIIEEIHETFYTEVDRLLSDAKIAKSLDTDKQYLIDKCSRLKTLGFINTKEVKEAEAEIERLNDLKLENEAKKTLIEAINYFSFKYPNYKFITEDSVKEICAKYNLVYGPIARYIGTVPDENLKHIEDFKIIDDDACYVKEVRARGGFIGADDRLISREYITRKDFEAEEELMKNPEYLYMKRMTLHHLSHEVNMRCPLEIAAPLKDFNMTNKEVKDFKISEIEIPDPVVLKPVIFNNQKHYLIVTAWGEEASDELVVNQKHN